MKKTSYTQKVLSVFMSILFLQSSILPNYLHASNDGPKSPEAETFEPVDATDMVSLLTGDFTYVLPILDIPSPEGGYPLALSYHAGIAMDQEATWVGLGWNLNPGALTRSINGYPDDYINQGVTDYFYDSGDTESVYNVSIGVNFAYAAASVGVGMSFSKGKAISGSVNMGVGIDQIFGVSASVGTNGASLGVNAGFRSKTGGVGVGLSASISTSGWSASAGLSVSELKGKTQVSGSINASIGGSWGGGDVNTSITGFASMTNEPSSTGQTTDNSTKMAATKGMGMGMPLSVNTSFMQDAYNVTQSSWAVPFYVPTPWGFAISGSFGKQTTEWHANEFENTRITGAINLNNSLPQGNYYMCKLRIVEATYNDLEYKYSTNMSLIKPLSAKPIDDPDDPDDPEYWEIRVENCEECYAEANNDSGLEYVSCWEEEVTNISYMDVYEVGIEDKDVTRNLDQSTAILPNYDKYVVSGQGISGSISPLILDNGNLVGLTKDLKDFELSFEIPTIGSTANDIGKFENKPVFQFDNTFGEPVQINSIDFNDNASSFTNYFKDKTYTDLKGLKKRGKYIKSFTNSQMKNSHYYNNAVNEGLLLAKGVTYDDKFENDGIGGFMITKEDGMTYHYSLPVYNFETITRQPLEGKDESEAYFENLLYKPYATHWLLTAITGSDYIKMDNEVYPTEEDYGYWVRFDYGKWTDGFTWRFPAGDGDHTKNDDGSYTVGRKQIYYLDQIKTRTHSAIFIKKERLDNIGKSYTYTYKYKGKVDVKSEYKSQSSLALDKVVLLKNEDIDVYSLKEDGSSLNVKYVSSTGNNIKLAINKDLSKERFPNYNLNQNILDINDLSGTKLDDLLKKAIRVINFTYDDYSLVKGSPNSEASTEGKLTLKSVNFGGYEGEVLLPPYKFDYINDKVYDKDKKDPWGYQKEDPTQWSMNKITTPGGASINIDYESDEFISRIDHELIFTEGNDNFKSESWHDNKLQVELTSTIKFSTYGVNDKIGDAFYYNNYPDDIEPGYGPPCPCPIGYEYDVKFIDRISDYKILVSLEYVNDAEEQKYFSSKLGTNSAIVLDIKKLKSGGLRVKNITTKAGDTEVKTVYDYNNPDTGKSSGVVSYIPQAQNTDTEIPYGNLVPGTGVMYEYVTQQTVSTLDENKHNGKQQFKFKVIPPKTSGNDDGYSYIKFGDMLEIRSYHKLLDSDSNKEVYEDRVEVINNTASLGQVSEIKSYNAKGDLMTTTINTFDNIEGVGTVTESFHSYKKVNYHEDGKKDKWILNSTTNTVSPNVMRTSTLISDGFENTTTFTDHDKLTGEVLKTKTVSSTGDELKTEVVPAYHKYPEMDSKDKNRNNKNMLTQETASYTLIKPAGESVFSYISANIQTWNNDWIYREYSGGVFYDQLKGDVDEDKKVWRKHRTYAWKGDVDPKYGTYIDFDTLDFNFHSDNQIPEWQRTSEITRYNHYSKALETMDINDNLVATKMGYNDSKVLATSNAPYTSFYYTGAEDIDINNYSGEVLINGVVKEGVTDSLAHTGSNYIEINSTNGLAINTNIGDNYGELKPEKYNFSFWSYGDNKSNFKIKVDDQVLAIPADDIETTKAKDFFLHSVVVDLSTYSGQSKTIELTSSSGTIRIDDFRMYPIWAQMQAYVYNEYGKLESIIGNNGLATKYFYDANGRLIETQIEIPDSNQKIPTGDGGFIKVSSTEYSNRYIQSNYVEVQDDVVIQNMNMGITLGYNMINGKYSITGVTTGDGRGGLVVGTIVSPIPAPTSAINFSGVAAITISTQGKVYYHTGSSGTTLNYQQQ